MAMRDSVTVSMALDTSGDATEMRRVSRDVVSASLGMTSVCPGISITLSLSEADESEWVGLVHFVLEMS